MVYSNKQNIFFDPTPVYFRKTKRKNGSVGCWMVFIKTELTDQGDIS